MNGIPLHDRMTQTSEKQLNFMDCYTQCEHILEKDEEARKIFPHVVEGLTNQEMALKLNLTIRKIENAKKRIKRKLSKFRRRYFR
jgi:DNA-binding NarL/FixJ family response regulator